MKLFFPNQHQFQTLQSLPQSNRSSPFVECSRSPDMESSEYRTKEETRATEVEAIILVCSGPMLPGSPPSPCPELLTESEAIRYLRLDTVDLTDPSTTLRRYRELNLLRATQVSKRLFYRRIELEKFLERATEHNPR